MIGRKNMNLFKNKRATALIGLFGILLLVLCAWLLLPAHSRAAKAEDTSGQNELVDQAGQVFAFPDDMTYGSIAEISAPHMRETSAESEIEYKLYFTYRYDAEVQIGEAFTNTEFSYYINAYMPAGKYRLSVSYGATQNCAPFAKELAFEVKTKDISQDATYAKYAELENVIDTELLRRTFSAYYTGEVLLPEVSASAEFDYERGADGASIWAETGADQYFTGYFATYRVSDTANGHYHSATELSDGAYMAAHGSETAPRAAGKYRIGYRLELANHTPSAEVYGRYFDFMIIETLPVPTIENEVYTGYAIQPKFEENRNYYALETDGCIDAETYGIKFVLRDTTCYKWAGYALGDPIAEADFTIEKAENVWSAPPRIANWVYGEYDPLLNSSFSAPRFLENGASVTYTYIESNEAGEELGEPQSAVPVNAGWYYLVAELAEGGNYYSLTGRTHFQIVKAVNVWETTPNITRWRYGEYDETVNRPVGKATDGETKFKFYRLDQDGERIDEGVDSMESYRRESDGKIPAGSYLMSAWVEESRNYKACRAEVTFSVLKAHNQWTTTPNIVRWHYGQYSSDDNVPYAVPMYGKAEDVTFSFYVADEEGNPTGEEYVGDMNGLRNADGKVPAGQYVLVANLEGSDDFESLHSEILFEILRVNNSWEVAPNITRWNQGSYDATINAISGKATYGDVVFTVKDAHGNVQSDLASLKAGVYTLTASVEGTNDYTELESTIAFVVFSPVGGEESVAAIVASILLGVACLGLISAFIALFIHYKKNYGEDE